MLGSALGGNSDLGGAQFIRGLGAFAVAHLAYLAFFVWALKLQARSIRVWALAYLPLLGLILFLVLPHAGSMQIPVIIYAVLILLTAAVGTAGNRAVAFGAALFVISDAILSLTLFIPNFNFWQSDLGIMFCYTIGQGLIICGATALLWQHEKRTSRGRPKEKTTKN
ncbi:lysoplasmalogenase [Arthrobacter sp. MYb227]|uniref:lysoplasmalogenase n=1 Tax=Arthrobacter sp. MYb227 TaxID=1848601 RepID=UPI0015E2D61C|nr:lysoplasmalogenase [Arthrobacter sp. MYb227]